MINGLFHGLAILLEQKIMKQLFFTLLALIPFVLGAQPVEGVIHYDQTVNMHARFQGNEEMLQYIPEFQTTKMELLIKGQSTLYKSAPQQEEEHESGDGNVRIRMNRNQSVVYRDLKGKKQLTATEFMGRKFLISEEIPSRSWKITGETKSILGKSCTKAVFKDTADVFEAWFTLDIPTSGGPGSYSGLPGMILEVNRNDGEMILSATNIEMKSLDAEKMEKPSKGKKVTREEYQAIVDEKMKEMGATSGGGTRTFIIRQ